MSECTCVERPVLNCLVHYNRSMAHRKAASRLAELEAENKELRSRLALDELLEERQEMEALRYAKEVLDNPPPGYDFAQSDFDSALAALLEQK